MSLNDSEMDIINEEEFIFSELKDLYEKHKLPYETFENFMNRINEFYNLFFIPHQTSVADSN